MRPRSGTWNHCFAVAWMAMCAVAFVPDAVLAQAGAAALANAVNKAGRQRMLTQRIVKLYCQTGMEIAAATARSQLAESIAVFERQLVDLEAVVSVSQTRRAFEQVAQLWPPVKKLASGPVNRQHVLRLHAASETLLEAAHRLTGELETGVALGGLVNLSGRQRMVSQRLAKLYMLRAWGVDLPGLAAEMEAAQAEFGAALGRLLRAGENTAEIDRELYAIAVQWEWFKSALAFEGIASYSLVVADASENILRSLERVVDLYEKTGSR